MVPISVLKPAPYNPRQWNEEQLQTLAESIDRFGFVDPIIINGAKNRKGVVIGGHMRLAAAAKLGMREVPAVEVHISNVEREKELNLRLNRSTGEWNWDMLKEFDFDLLQDVGFSADEIASACDGMLETEDDGFDAEKELEKITEPKSKTGDLYQLGPHRLMCGDGTDPAVVQRLVGKERIHLIDIDPPFNINLSYASGVGGTRNYGGMTNDKKSEAEYVDFLRKLLGNALNVAEKDCHVFYWNDERHVGLVQTLFHEFGLNHKRICIWIKNGINVTPNNAFNKCTEYALYATRGKPYLSPHIQNLTEILNKEIGTGNRTIEDILDIINIWMVKRLPGTEYTHPTEKSPMVHERALRRCSRPDDCVLDLCAGSGSLMAACHQMRRRAFLCEIDPRFVDVILARAVALGISPCKL